ncbi:hypothetical protein AAHA92_31493 [Salvia divinorum]|uniref:Uncharacterized protein n=1 Tax=Salvia divinorum TaxID=28513 RepID=A0ABD1FQK3_SALDI
MSKKTPKEKSVTVKKWEKCHGGLWRNHKICIKAQLRRHRKLLGHFHRYSNNLNQTPQKESGHYRMILTSLDSPTPQTTRKRPDKERSTSKQERPTRARPVRGELANRARRTGEAGESATTAGKRHDDYGVGVGLLQREG